MKIRKTKKGGLVLRQASFKPETINEEDRTVELVFSTGSRVERFDFFDGHYIEELSMKKSDIRMDRLNNGGAPLLDSHMAFGTVRNQFGVVERAEIKDGEGVATVRFSRREDVEPIFQDVKDGILRNISVGYRTYKMKEVGKDENDVRILRAIDWEPHELSLVSVPADANAQIRKQTELNECEIIFEGEEMLRFDKHGNEIDEKGTIVRTAEQVKADGDWEKFEAYKAENFRSEESEEAPAEEEKAEESEEKESEEAPAEEEKAEESEERSEENLETRENKKAILDAERKRVADIRELGTKYSVDKKVIDELEKSGKNIEQVRSAILDYLADNDKNTRNLSFGTVGNEMKDLKKKAIVNALMHRHNPGTELTADGRMYRGYSLLDISRDILEGCGISTRGMSKSEIADGVLLGRISGLHSSSDFKEILADIVNKTLRDAYEAAPQTWSTFTRVVSTPDFKQISRVQLGDAPSLEKVQEGGEITRGTIGEQAEKYNVETFGRIVGITRKTIINDDLSAFTRLPEMWGRAARDLESDLIYDEIKANPNLADGNPVFDAVNHNNFTTGPGTAISIDSLGVARALMRRQVGLNGRLINVMGRYLLVPAALETKADQFVSQITPDQSGNVNPFSGRLQVIAEPRLDDDSLISWYVMADPSQIDMIELARLEGQSGPEIVTREGFEIEGIEVKARMDIGVKIIDYRGMYKNAGV